MAETPKAWRSVLDRVEADLFSGRLGPGDRLPGERELASTMGVGRSSVREALRVLEVMGVVRTAVGSGPSSGA
ncbi:MAG: FadR/GntR family transcriptional regulator, partial [Microbacterium sp.]